MNQKCSQGSLRRNSNEESKWSVLALWWFLRGHQENRQDTRCRHFTTNNSCNSCSPSLPICVFMLFSLLFIYNAYFFPVPLLPIWKVKKKKKSWRCVSTVASVHIYYFLISPSLFYNYLSLVLRWKNRAEQSVRGRRDLERDWNSLRINDC